MGSTTGIEWADATVNVWEGCTKVSPACKNCYAETNSPVRAMEVRIGEALGVESSADGKRRLKMWGPSGFRYETANWEAQLRALNRKAAAFRVGYQAGGGERCSRPRVFINSLSDIFEDWQGLVYRLDDGHPVVVAHSLDSVRERFFRAVEECTELDILLLTKRPENVLGMLPYRWYGTNDFARTHSRIPEHIWFGTTVEDQTHADKRIPELLKVPAKVRFLSIEPLLGKVDLERHLWQPWEPSRGPVRDKSGDIVPMRETGHIHWVIVGGESGHGDGIRAMDPDWVRSIRDQCVAAGVPFFFKQWGEWLPCERGDDRELSFSEPKEVRVLEGDRPSVVLRIGKKKAGRMLDGREWSEVPK